MKITFSEQSDGNVMSATFSPDHRELAEQAGIKFYRNGMAYFPSEIAEWSYGDKLASDILDELDLENHDGYD